MGAHSGRGGATSLCCVRKGITLKACNFRFKIAHEGIDSFSVGRTARSLPVAGLAGDAPKKQCARTAQDRGARWQGSSITKYSAPSPKLELLYLHLPK